MANIKIHWQKMQFHKVTAISVTLTSWTWGTATFTPATGTSYVLSSLPVGTQVQKDFNNLIVFKDNTRFWTIVPTASSWYNIWDIQINGTTITSTPVTLDDWDVISVAFSPLGCLCFTANTAGSTVKLKKVNSPASVTLETSTDKINWATYTIWTTITLANVWDKVYWRNTSTTDTLFNTSVNNYYRFVMTWSIAWSWDINYLLNKNGTTTISDYCYYSIFRWCTSLTTAPVLPATTLASHCYHSMFSNCSALISAPTLPATTSAQSCYDEMFSWCSNLTTLPALPATTLASECYYYMFYNCTKIKLSETQTWEYQTEYRIPTTWTWTTGSNSLSDMFIDTGWTFTGTPTINTTYYTSNTVVS